MFLRTTLKIKSKLRKMRKKRGEKVVNKNEVKKFKNREKLTIIRMSIKKET